MKVNFTRLSFIISNLIFIGQIFSQNCTVNAGIDQIFCSGDIASLSGGQAGLVDVSGVWSQIGGPTAIIDDPSDLNTNLLGLTPGNTYTFLLTASCDDGSLVTDQASVTLNPITISDAGIDIEVCPGTYSLSGNTIGANETAVWSIVGANGAGIVLDDINDPNSSFTLPNNKSGTTILRWRVEHTNGCVSIDLVSVTNFGGNMTISAGPDRNLSNCYTAFQNVTLAGSFAGTGFNGQSGIWTLVNGPSYPNIVDASDSTTVVSQLIEGTYLFQWTVTGPCVSGSSQVTIVVPEATQDVTNANAPNVVHCNSTTTALLVGNPVSFAGETVQWTYISGGNSTPVITNPNDPSTSVTNLVDGNYLFSYTITNPVTNCFDIDYARIIFITNSPTIASVTDTIFSCGDSLVSVPYTISGNGVNRYRIISGPFTTGWLTAGTGALSLNLNTSGIYNIELRKGSGGIECQNAFDKVVAVVGFPPSASNAGTNQNLGCGVTNTSLAANIPTNGAGQWSQVSGPNTAVIASSTASTTPISGLIGGSYVFKWLISTTESCLSEESVVTINVTTALPVTADPDFNACENSAVILNGSNLNNGDAAVWTVSPTGPTINNSSNSTATANGLLNANSPYTFTYTVTNVCGSVSDDIVVSVASSGGPTDADAGSDQCLSNGTTSTALSGNDPTVGTGAWSLVSGPVGSSFDLASDPITNFNVVSDGTYTLVWEISELGCQMTSDTVLITIGTGPLADAGLDEELCYSSITGFNLSGNDASPGLGTWSLVSGPGSMTITSVNDEASSVFFVEPGTYVFNWSIDDGVCSTGPNEDFVEIKVGLIPSMANAGPDATVCGATTTSLAAVVPTSGTGNWSAAGVLTNTPNIANTSLNNTGISGLATGIYEFKWTVSTSAYCPVSEDNVLISVSAPATAGSDENFCFASEVELFGTVGANGTWSLQSGPAVTLTPTSGYTAIAAVTPGNSYDFRFTAPSLFGCPVTTDDVTVNTSSYATLPNAGADIDLCTSAGTSIIMTANVITEGTGLWTQVVGPNTASITNTALPNTTVTSLIQGLYVFEWQSSNGFCNDFADVVRVNVYDPPTVADAGSDQLNACARNLTLEGNTPLNGLGTWTQISGPNTANIDFPIQPNTTISGAIVGTYVFQWEISAGGGVCPSSQSSVTITIPAADPTIPQAGSDFNVCGTFSSTLSGNPITVGTGTWIVHNGPNTPSITDINLENTTITNLMDGDYELVWQSTNGGCVFNDTVTLSYTSPSSAANAGLDDSFCPFETILLTADAPTSGMGMWTQTSGPVNVFFVDPSSPTTQISGTVPGVYNLTWTVSSGSCPVSTDIVEITIESNCAPIVTNEAEITAEDTPLIVGAESGVLSNDSDGENDDLSVLTEPLSGPSNGNITVATDGSYTYTPDLDFTGIDTVVVNVCDDGSPVLCTNDTIFITVTPVNDPPVAVQDNVTTNQNQPITGIDVTENDTDPDNNIDSTSVTVPTGSSSNGGVVTVNADGTVHYIPPFGFSGNDTIVYTVCDSTGLCDTDIIVINVVGDTDGDGIADSIDIDDDNDGIPDTEEGSGDTDGDGILDIVDLDSDNDGIPDIVEAGGVDIDGDGVIDAQVDTDGDGISDAVDVDITMGMDGDSDGIDDAFQVGTDTDGDGIDDSNDPDADGNGMDDLTEMTPLPNVDTDGDGLNNTIDLDSDNDGITDIIEAGGTDLNGDGQMPVNSNGTLVDDVDGDGFSDGVDQDDNTTAGINDGGSNWPNSDTDGDGINNLLDLDSDNDGIADIIEAGGVDADGDGQVPVNGDGTLVNDLDGDGLTDDLIIDTDADGIADQIVDVDATGGSPLVIIDTDMDGNPDGLDIDADNDGITDIIEAGGVDVDNDGHIDYATPGDPSTINDVDGDGFADVVDTDDNTTAGTADGGSNWPTPDTDIDGISNHLDIDADNDGIVDNVEGQSTSGYTGPTGSDTDGDGLDDAYDSDDATVVGVGDGPGTSVNPVDTDLDTMTDYLDLDSDNDGEGDLIEGWDTDNDGVADTNPSGLDSDGDGLDDAFDDFVLDGTNGPSGVNGSNGTTPGTYPDLDLPGIGNQDWRENDNDGDGINDVDDIDDDNDGIPDYVEICGPGATGFTCTIDPALDDDMDGIPNMDDPDYTGNLDTDGDGILDVFDLDSDNDGIPDIIEGGGADVNGDGLIDELNADGTLTNDTDNDGWADNEGLPNPPDFDNDGQPDFQDLDSDNDGIADIVEQGGVDTNNDGYVDVFDPNTGILSDDTDPSGNNDGWTNTIPLTDDEDTDGDGLPDRADLDSDNDGIPDVVEDGGVDANGDGEVDGFVDVNSDGWDDNNPTDGLADFDNDGIPNHEDLDADNDGIPDVVEGGNSDVNGDGLLDDINPDGTLVNDVDGDGWDDNNGVSDPIDTDGEGNDNYLDLDSDNDGVADIIESGGDDTNGDGMIDSLNPDGTLVNDPEGNGWDNGIGISDPVDTDGEGIDNYLDLDSDNDGISDVVESGADDTDGDGMVDNFDNTDGDGWDMSNGSTDLVDTDGDGIDDLLDLDSDNDGISDVEEGGGTDLDNDGLVDDFSDPDGDGWDNNDGTSDPVDTDNDGVADYLDLDSDDDGIDDIDEGFDGVDNPLDTDNDGVVDVITDSDGDGWDDAGVSTGDVVDTDGDGDADYQDLDSDEDGLVDADENDPNGDGIGPDDTDGDGIPDYRDEDSDGDGVPDEVEWDITNDGSGADDCDNDGIPNYLDLDICDISIPQGFSPNGDGVHDTFVIDGLEYYPNSTFTVFNRWGNIVWKSVDGGYVNDFDGRNNNDKSISIGGDELPVGTYFYIFEPNRDYITDGAGKVEVTKGYIYLNR